MSEQWKSVAGFEGLYEVSSLGRVRRMTTGWRSRTYVGRILKPIQRPNGYFDVTLCHGGKKWWLKLHRLVAIAFVGPAPSDSHEVNHRDCDKANNLPENLEWLTHAENMDHAKRNDRWHRKIA